MTTNAFSHKNKLQYSLKDGDDDYVYFLWWLHLLGNEDHWCRGL